MSRSKLAQDGQNRFEPVWSGFSRSKPVRDGQKRFEPVWSG
ncbi:hypothetical protein CP02DC14_1496 [Chlamydia psittaci 02DC14]|nr:hypothetical protein CP03DC29_1374 [Chlamydia psittaci 03DC29]EPL03067.1 hypothetical protein CP02DC14_1496 [Chlamydia psittaci 02DC14]EPP30624.1 hypothetical protein CPC197_1862 [Chlamydia psittaci C1/97]EPP32935.1 hypothetical protein CPC698_1358 [Chlamydia psittaci C6/98]